MSDNPRPFQPTPPDPVVMDAEFFIRQAMSENPRTGYELLFRKYYRGLLSHVVRFVHAKSVAEDIVGDVFLSIWKNEIHQSLTGSYRAYLYAAVRKRACAHLRDEFKVEDTDGWPTGKEPSETDDPQQILQYTELYARIENVVKSLPPQCQRVFIMSRFEGKKHREIADELHIAPKTIEQHMMKALSLLRNVFRV